MNIRLPLNIEHDKLQRIETEKESIDRFLNVLLTSARNTCPSDPEFGFIFNNLKFEIFNEREGVVYNSSDKPELLEDSAGLYKKKISGSSKNLNTFASELKNTIIEYEKRLSDVSTSMTYIREERLIYINIKGIIKAGNLPYDYTTTLKVWK